MEIDNFGDPVTMETVILIVCALIEWVLFYKHYILVSHEISLYPWWVAVYWSASMVNSTFASVLMLTPTFVSIQYKLTTTCIIIFAGFMHMIYTDVLGIVQLLLTAAMLPVLHTDYRACIDLERRLKARREYVPPHPMVELKVLVPQQVETGVVA